MYNKDYFASENYFRIEDEKKRVRALGNAAGLSIIGYVIIQNIMSVMLMLTPFNSLYLNDAAFQSVVTIFLSVFSMLIPFGICGYYFQKKTDTEVFNFEKPVSTKLMVFAVAFGFFGCLAANYVTGIFVEFMAWGGVELSLPGYPVPSDTSGRLIYAVSVAVVPALVEEFAIRGAILQPMRKYGDWFAIIASSLVFAVLHGNLIQAPFAFVAGVVIGYAVCITESIWTGVIIHFFNNLYSAMTTFMVADITDEEKLVSVFTKTEMILYVISIAGSVLFVIARGKRRLKKSQTKLDMAGKMWRYVLSLPMLVAFFMMFTVTSGFVDITSFAGLLKISFVMLAVAVAAVVITVHFKKMKANRDCLIK